MLIETRYCRRIVSKFGDIYFCDVAFAILLSAIVYLSSRKSVQYVTKTLTKLIPASRWNFPAQVPATYLPSTTLEPTQWPCTASELPNWFQLYRLGYWTQESIFQPQGSIPSERAPSMVTGKAKMENCSWFATRRGRLWKSASTSGVFLSQRSSYKLHIFVILISF